MSQRVRTTLQVGGILLLVVVLMAPGLRAQFSSGGGVGPDLSGYVTTTALNTAVADMQSTVMAAMPQPANTAPVTDATVAAIGSITNRYQLPDAVRPARYRSGSCTISGGQCTITWSTAFPSTPNPIGDPAALNANTGIYIQCNWVSISTTNAVVKCAAPLVTISLGLLNLLPSAANGTVVSATAVQPL